MGGLPIGRLYIWMYQVQWVSVGLWVCVFEEVTIKKKVTLSHYKKGKELGCNTQAGEMNSTNESFPVHFCFSLCRWSFGCPSDTLSLCNRGVFMCLADVIGVDWAQGEQMVLMCWFPRALTVILWHDPLWLGPQTQCDWTMHTSILYEVEMILNECIFVYILYHGSMCFASDLWTLLCSMQSYQTYMQHSDLL